MRPESQCTTGPHFRSTFAVAQRKSNRQLPHREPHREHGDDDDDSDQFIHDVKHCLGPKAAMQRRSAVFILFSFPFRSLLNDHPIELRLPAQAKVSVVHLFDAHSLHQ
jgi:hypothetical protein